MRKRRTTLKDIAESTGLHVSTVSRALDPSMRGSISEEVVKRILSTAEAMGYRQNRMAYGLRTNRSMAIGVVLPDIANVIFPPIVRGVEAVLEPLGYVSVIVNTDNSVKREQRLLEVLFEYGVDGVIHAAGSREDPAALELARQGVPLVTVNRRIEESSIPYVVNDEEDGLEKIIDHLYALGHRRIAHIAGQQNTSTGHDRLEAFSKACRKRKLRDWRRRVATATSYTQDEGHRCMHALLDRDVPISAVVAANDMLALGAIAALGERGLKCPRDVSVTGFNDMPFLDHMPPALTTVRIEQFSAGKAAAELLGKMMRQEEHVKGIVLPVSLIERSSTRAPLRSTTS